MTETTQIAAQRIMERFLMRKPDRLTVKNDLNDRFVPNHFMRRYSGPFRSNVNFVYRVATLPQQPESFSTSSITSSAQSHFRLPTRSQLRHFQSCVLLTSRLAVVTGGELNTFERAGTQRGGSQ
jgi:hypothetical protein